MSAVVFSGSCGNNGCL